MAERMKQKLLEHNLASVVAGPDAYRDLPTLLSVARGKQRAMNVALSKQETYFDIEPLRDTSSATAWVSIQRGCSNMCSYCIVPHTRGSERSRPVDSILKEVERASRAGFKEVTLLGQNVNSYFFKQDGDGGTDSYRIADGFSDNFMGSARRGDGVRFAELLDLVAQVDDDVRVRFTSPHQKILLTMCLKSLQVGQTYLVVYIFLRSLALALFLIAWYEGILVKRTSRS